MSINAAHQQHLRVSEVCDISLIFLFLVAESQLSCAVINYIVNIPISAILGVATKTTSTMPSTSSRPRVVKSSS